MKKKIILSLLVISIIMIAVVIIANVVNKGVDIVETVTDTDRVIYTYERFYNTHAAVLSYYDQVEVANESVETFKIDHAGNLDTMTNSKELSRLREVERGLTNMLITTVNKYNADAENVTRGIFKDWRLPSRITYENNELTFED